MKALIFACITLLSALNPTLALAKSDLSNSELLSRSPLIGSSTNSLSELSILLKKAADEVHAAKVRSSYRLECHDTFSKDTIANFPSPIASYNAFEFSFDFQADSNGWTLAKVSKFLFRQVDCKKRIDERVQNIRREMEFDPRITTHIDNLSDNFYACGTAQMLTEDWTSFINSGLYKVEFIGRWSTHSDPYELEGQDGSLKKIYIDLKHSLPSDRRERVALQLEGESNPEYLSGQRYLAFSTSIGLSRLNAIDSAGANQGYYGQPSIFCSVRRLGN